MIQHRILASLTLIVAALTASCSDSSTADPRSGSVRFALRTEMGDRIFELQQAEFAITGPSEATLTSDDTPEALIIEQELAVGSYEAELQSGWQLVELTADGVLPVEASLLGDNPIQFTIEPSLTTAILYRFAVGDAEVQFAVGELQVAIEVVHEQSGTVIFNELMSNPAVLSDGEGEWLELQNTADSAVNLQGCSIERDTTGYVIEGPLSVEPGAVATVASGDSPGFLPDYVVPTLSLPNTGTYALKLVCAGQVLDALSIDPTALPGGPGIAASLSSDRSNALANDAPANWCAASNPYNGDLGTPGTANPVCGG